MAEPAPPLLTADSAQDLFQAVANACVARLRGDRLLVRVAGVLGTLPPERKGWHWEVRLTDPAGGVLLLQFPATLARRHGLSGGEGVVATGAIRAKVWQGRLELRIQVLDFVPDDIPHPETPGFVAGPEPTAALLKRLPVERRTIPERLPLSVLLIHPAAARTAVDGDFRAGLGRAASWLRITPVPVPMDKADILAAEIASARADILVVIRGGGETESFETFDRPEVLTALAGGSGFRLLGLGHSGDRTLADLLADHVAVTPSDAGHFLRSRVGAIQARRRDREAASAAAERAHPPPNRPDPSEHQARREAEAPAGPRRPDPVMAGMLVVIAVLLGLLLLR